MSILFISFMRERFKDFQQTARVVSSILIDIKMSLVYIAGYVTPKRTFNFCKLCYYSKLPPTIRNTVSLQTPLPGKDLIYHRTSCFYFCFMSYSIRSKRVCRRLTCNIFMLISEFESLLYAKASWHESFQYISKELKHPFYMQIRNRTCIESNEAPLTCIYLNLSTDGTSAASVILKMVNGWEQLTIVTRIYISGASGVLDLSLWGIRICLMNLLYREIFKQSLSRRIIWPHQREV